jgi:hypothetical protein
VLYYAYKLGISAPVGVLWPGAFYIVNAAAWVRLCREVQKRRHLF